MKFLEAKSMPKADGQENKMRRGSRPDQNQFIPKGSLHPDNPPTVKAEVANYAKSVGIDLARVTGSGRGGEITMRDVRDAKTQDDKDKDQDDK